MVHGPKDEVSVWRRFVFPFLFVLALFVVLFLRRPDADSQTPQRQASAQAQDALPTEVLRGQTMGTTYQIKLVTTISNSEDRDALQKKIDSKLEAINDLMSTYRPNSALSKLNRNQSTEPIKLHPDFGHVVQEAVLLGKQTQGAFDVTLAPLIELWGFDKGEPRTVPPSLNEIEAAKAFTGLNRITIQSSILQKNDPRVQINLSGIAKGFGVDAISQLLTEAGFENFMVEIGGELRVRGHNATRDPWRLGVNRPTPESGQYEVIETVSLSNGAMATSGSYRNFFDDSGKRFHHIINPQTGFPVEHKLVSVTIIAPTCMLADGLATAAMVLGQQQFETIRQKTYPDVAAYYIHQKAGSFEQHKSANFPSAVPVTAPSH